MFQLNELSMKLDNAKKQLHDRIDKEEQERYSFFLDSSWILPGLYDDLCYRYTAVKELQDEISKMRNGKTGRDGAVGNTGGGGPSNVRLITIHTYITYIAYMIYSLLLIKVYTSIYFFYRMR